MLPEPLPAELSSSGEPILILGFMPDGAVLYVNTNGGLEYDRDSLLTTDWRYDAENDTWLDKTLASDEK